jgi:hypothetical protein
MFCSCIFKQSTSAESTVNNAQPIGRQAMKRTTLFYAVIPLWLAAAPAAFGADITGQAALALAGVVAAHAPNLSPADKKAAAAAFDGRTDLPYSGKIRIAADKIVCRASNVDIAARSCDLAFGRQTISLRGREANELYATQAMAGIAPDGAAGSTFERMSKLDCTLDPAEIKSKSGGGAACSYQAGN